MFKQKINSFVWISVFITFIGFFFMTHSFAGENGHHLPITNELIVFVEHDSNLKNLLIKSIESAKKVNPDKTTNPVQNLEEYYNFLDWAAQALPWKITDNNSETDLYDQINQSLNYFYFINDQPLPELEGYDYYNNSLQYYPPYRLWMILFTKQWGLFLNSPESWNDECLKKAQADVSFGLQNEWYEDPSHWKSFNDFFSRNLLPGARPITSPDDDSVLTFPADSKPQGIWMIDANSNVKFGVKIKSKRFQSVPNLLGPESAYKNSFSNGTLTHTFLDVNDYHHYHFPISGTIKEVHTILQDDASGGTVSWDPKLKKYVLHSKIPGWESIETRGCVILETEKFGLVALLPVGMSQVSSVNFEKTVVPGAKVKKGDPLGYFLFGGSDFVMLFQKQVKFHLTVPKERDGTYPHDLMGKKYAHLTLKHTHRK